ncbi:MAG TPA: heparinase, partial [Rariglobus sp.]
LRLSDGKRTCMVWLNEAVGLEGSFAYVLLDETGVPVAAGLKGVALSGNLLSIRLKAPGSAEFLRDPSGAWRPASAEQTGGVVHFAEAGPRP